MMTRTHSAIRFLSVPLLGAVLLAAALVSPARSADITQPSFATPEQAVEQLVEAARAGHVQEVRTILGPGSAPLLRSGDAVADAQARKRFLDAYDEEHSINREADKRASLVIGKDDWPFPIPIVQRGEQWRFDSSAGAKEVLNRRIGENELSAIEAVRAYVDAQREFAELDRDHDGYVEYAQKFLSSPGRRDGLYWPAKAAEEESPLGPLMASARGEGYSTTATKNRQPYHGYYYRILKAQGASAQGGAYDYVANGHMIGGFALIAFPARYGVSGVMSFMVNQDGIVYQKDLGPNTASLAEKMKGFDPDPSWKAVELGQEGGQATP